MPPLPLVEDITLRLASETLAAKAEMEKAGYRIPARPTLVLPQLPKQPAEMTDDALMERFTDLVRWSDHIGGLLALQEVDERYADSTYDLIWAQVLAENAPRSRNEGSVTVAKAECLQHPQVREAIANRDNIYARRKMFGLMFSNLERDTNVLSRELTRRLGRAPTERRADRWTP